VFIRVHSWLNFFLFSRSVLSRARTTSSSFVEAQKFSRANPARGSRLQLHGRFIFSRVPFDSRFSGSRNRRADVRAVFSDASRENNCVAHSIQKIAANPMPARWRHKRHSRASPSRRLFAAASAISRTSFEIPLKPFSRFLRQFAAALPH